MTVIQNESTSSIRQEDFFSVRKLERIIVPERDKGTSARELHASSAAIASLMSDEGTVGRAHHHESARQNESIPRINTHAKGGLIHVERILQKRDVYTSDLLDRRPHVGDSSPRKLQLQRDLLL